MKTVEIGLIIGLVLTMVVTLSLVGTVVEQVEDAQDNLTGAASTLAGLIPLFYVILPIGLVTAVILYFFKSGR